MNRFNYKSSTLFCHLLDHRIFHMQTYSPLLYHPAYPGVKLLLLSGHQRVLEKSVFPDHLNFLSHNCQDFSFQVILTFNHSSGHFQVFLLRRDWECGLLSPLLYFTSLLEGKKVFLAWGCREDEKKNLELSRFFNFVSHLIHKVEYIYASAPPSWT